MRWMDNIRHGMNTAKGVLKEEDAQDGEEYTEPEKRDLAPSLDKHEEYTEPENPDVAPSLDKHE